MPRNTLNVWERRTLIEALFRALQNGWVSHRQDAQALLLKLERAERIRLEAPKNAPAQV
jgi:hypothetical protein